MANTFFKFKQFTVNQAHCAMKVCTDACIQGAFTAQYLADGHLTVSDILDIGAGTGLLSLMLAQQVNATITAVELDPGAAQQAIENFNTSPWAGRLFLAQQDVRKMDVKVKYDFIISNPPFYEVALKSGHAQKDQAMHATNLSYKELIAAIDQYLQPSGQVSVMLPYVQFEEFRVLAQAAGYYLLQVMHIRQSVHHGYFRATGIFGKTPAATITQELAIYDAGNVYTSAFVQLLQPYYLYL
jgi:tRNA1Val (adenine37-N6)-methyltransferase